MKKVLLLLGVMSITLHSFAQYPPTKREVRGAWIATVGNIDWPSRTQTPAQQRAALITILEHHRVTGINVIYFQVRSQCDAMYPSQIEPWSADMNGLQGRAPSPLWDPMQFAIEECRKRGMEFHAWINPYRAVSTATQLVNFSPVHVAKQHPEWLLNNGTTITLDPGIPAVRNYIMSVITDIVQRYDVDGIHFDDYFYPPGTFNDNASFTADPRGFTIRADWRRDNVNLFIQNVYQTIQGLKPWVKFGVSPSGIYRNATNPEIGSNTKGNEHYNAVYADSKKWLQQGWVDYIEPQVYWYIGQLNSDYEIIVPWWNNNSYGRHIYIGMAGYKVNDPLQGINWANPSMIPREVKLNRSYANVYGQAIYNTSSLRSTTKLGFRDSLRLFFYQKPALQPTMPWRDAIPPLPASLLTSTKYGNDSVVLHWSKPPDATNELDKVKRFVVYRSTSPVIDINDANNILVITVNDTSAYNDKTIAPGTTYYYTVTALDRFHNESIISNVVADQPPSIVCGGNQPLDLVTCTVVLPDYRQTARITNATVVTQFPEPGTLVNGGIVSITITAENAAGQTASCNFNVAVKDRTAPIVSPVMPSTTEGSITTFTTSAGHCYYEAGNQLDITATDNCNSMLAYSYTLTYQGITGSPVASPSLESVHFNKGLTIVNWKVSDDAGNETFYSYSIQVRDEELPVIAVCPADKTVGTDQGVCTAKVEPGMPVVTDNCGVVSITGLRSDGLPLDARYPNGVTTIIWSVKDASGNEANCEQTIVVEDRELPVITGVSVNPASLFPPNHKMKHVTVTYTVADNCGPVRTSLSVSSNEPINGTGDGDTDVDWEVIDEHHITLRAERSGNGNGRVYTITINATDASGNIQTQQVTVLVPHDRSDITQSKAIAGNEENSVSIVQAVITPNPSKDQFVLTMKSKNQHLIDINIVNNSGRIMEARKGLDPNGVVIFGSNFSRGVYFIKITQGLQKQTLKIVKK